MKKVVVTGKTIEEAVQQALKQLGTTEDKVKINVIEQPSKGLFGFIGAKNAEVEVTVEADPIGDAKRFLSDVLVTMGLSNVSIEELTTSDTTVFNLVGPDLGILIGRRGQTLDSLQYLVNLVANKEKSHEYVRIVLDAENYRARREETLQNLADRLAQKAIRLKTNVVLEPMTPLERKIIHTQLQDHDLVMTTSEGEEPNRRVVIKLKK